MADAYTRLSDAIVPDVWARYQFEESVEKMDIFQAGVMYSDPEVQSNLASGGYVVDMPMWDDLADIPSEPVNDDPTDEIEIKKVTSRKQRAARNIRAQAWGVADLTKILAGDDPMRIITSRQSNYWMRANKRTVISMLKGILADNIANDGGDLLSASTTSLTDESVIDAAYKQGDHADEFSTIWMTSRQMLILRKQELIDFRPSPDSNKPMLLPYYQGLRVVTDDELGEQFSTVAAANTTDFTAFLFKPNAIIWNEMPVELEGGPLEEDRNPRAGHGAGTTWVVSRRHFVPHMKGFSYTGTPAGDFATDVELATATSWDRVTQYQKNVPFIAIRSREATPGTTV